MLRDLERLVATNEQYGYSEQDIVDAAAFLRAKQFVWKERHGHGRHYDLICKFREYYENLFEAFGDEFFIDGHFGYCGILPRDSKPRLKKLETIYLLLLAKMHDIECRKALTSLGRSSPSESHLLDHYTRVTGKEKPKPSETSSALERLVRMGIIELGDHNPDSEMRRITILPSIMKVVTKDFLDDLKVFCSDGADEQDGDKDVDEIDESAPTGFGGEEN